MPQQPGPHLGQQLMGLRTQGVGQLPAAGGQVEDGGGSHMGSLHVVGVIKAALAAGAAGAAAPPAAAAATQAAAAAGGVACGAAGRARGLAVPLRCSAGDRRTDTWQSWEQEAEHGSTGPDPADWIQCSGFQTLSQKTCFKNVNLKKIFRKLKTS